MEGEIFTSGEATANDAMLLRGVKMTLAGHDPTAYHQVYADKKLVYAGYDRDALSRAWLNACQGRAKRIRHLVNGIECDSAQTLKS